MFQILSFWSFCIFIHYLLSKCVYRLGLKIGLDKSPPLYDVIQQNFPSFQNMRFIPEITHIIPIMILIKMIIMDKSPHTYRAITSFFKIHGVLMLLRGLCFSGTLLPDSSQMCFESKHIGSCFDLIFSGHSTIMILTSYIIRDNFEVSNFMNKLLSFNNIFTCLLIILCRNHYTVDVLVSILLTYFVYSHFTGFVSGNSHQFYL